RVMSAHRFSWLFLIGVVLLMSPRVVLGADTALVQAVKTRNESAVRELVRRRVDVNAMAADGVTALHWAAHRDELGIANWLLSAGAVVNVRNDFGVTPLWLAALNGSPTMVRLLLRAKADANAALPSGETALMTAARTGNPDVVAELLAA